MRKVQPFATLFAVIALGSGAFAQNAQPAPPDNAKPLSSIVAEIEKRPDFRFVDSIEWEEGGYYEITYHTTDKAKVEIKIDAVSGATRD